MKELCRGTIEFRGLKVEDSDLENAVVKKTSANHCIGILLRLKSAHGLAILEFGRRTNEESTYCEHRYNYWVHAAVLIANW